MIDNHYTLPVWSQFSVFHDSSEHSVIIDIDGDKIYEEVFSPGEVYNVKIEKVYDFRSPNLKKITLFWNSDHETANKYLVFNKWVINSQRLTVYQSMYIPNENEYIKNIKANGTLEEKQNLRKQIMFGGNRFGWFGKLLWEFALGNSAEIKKTLINDTPEHIFYVKTNKIFLDPMEAKTYDRIEKKN